jgi:DNA-directed RNA polymerase subunit RPC12/RpoP
MRRACPRCSGAVQQKSLGRLSAEDAPLKLTVEGMPAAVCDKNHASPVDSDFMLWLIHELKQRDTALPTAAEKGALFKKYLCAACGKELASKSERRQSYPLELAYAGYPPFKAEIEMPVYKCTGCGKEQLRSAKEVQKHTSMAIAALNDAAGFPHA